MTNRLERLINLVIALREARVPLAAGEIRERVAGYGQDDYEAFRRMFERDKADLRALGVPVETAPLDAWGDRLGYRIDPERYDLPELAFDSEELAALALALEATGLAGEAAGGMRKLAVDAHGEAGEAGEAGVPPAADARPRVDLDVDAPHLAVLMEAQVSRTPVRFAYAPARAGQEAAARTVEPHALVHRNGRWYVVGHDRDRQARRAFRLDRISGSVRPAGPPGSFDVPGEPVGPADVVPEAPAPERTAVVAADPDVAWQVARRARGAGQPLDDGRTAYQVPVGDPERFVTWVLGWAGEVEVRSPAELRAEVASRLRLLAGLARPGGEA